VTRAQRKALNLYRKMQDLRDQYNAACLKAFPVGTEVAYAHGEALRFGTVADSGYGHRLKIRSSVNPNAAPWIDTYRILDELE
jgi:hypothetical protein